jgi:hypothetical protein
MEQGQGRPITGDRYDPYDPRHPMWTDPFWAAYCTNPANPQAPAALSRPTRDAWVTAAGNAIDSASLPVQ